MGVLRCVMFGDYRQLHDGKNLAVNILLKNRCAFCHELFRPSTLPGAWILDPFTGSSTTGIAANLLGRRFLGIDQNEEFLELSKARRNELNSINRRNEILIKLEKQANLFRNKDANVFCEPEEYYGLDLPF